MFKNLTACNRIPLMIPNYAIPHLKALICGYLELAVQGRDSTFPILPRFHRLTAQIAICCSKNIAYKSVMKFDNQILLPVKDSPRLVTKSIIKYDQQPVKIERVAIGRRPVRKLPAVPSSKQAHIGVYLVLTFNSFLSLIHI